MTDAFRPEDLTAHGERLRALARSLVRDAATADDVVQDAWVAAVDRPPAAGTPVFAWLARVVRNLSARTHRDRARRLRREECAARPDEVPAAAHVAAEIETHRRLLAAVERLDEPYRSAVVLRFLDGLPPREIAKRLDVPAARVSTWVHRGLERLRRDLSGGDDEALIALLLPVVGGALRRSAKTSSAVATKTLLTSGAAMTTHKLAFLTGAAVLLIGGLVVVGSGVLRRPTGAEQAPAVVATEGSATRRHVVEEAPARAADETEEEVLLPAPVDLDACDRDRDLFGRVVDEDGEPVPGAAVATEWNPWTGLGTAGIGRWQERETGPETRAARDGSFALRLDRGALVDLRVTADGYAPLLVTSCQAGERLDVVLREGATLALTVREPGGALAAGVQVHVRIGGNLVGHPLDPDEQRLDSTTGDDGAAEITGLLAGWATVWASEPSSGRQAWRTVEVPGAGRVALDVELAEARVTRGTVTDATTGAPIEGAEVVPYGLALSSAVTDGDGRYELRTSSASATSVYVTATGHETARLVVRDDSAHDVALLPGDRMVARLLLPDGTPAAGARVVVRAPQGGGRTAIVVDGVADEGGRVAVDGLHHGAAHTLIAAATGGGRTVLDFDTPPGPRGTVDLGDVVLGAARRIEGAATDASGRPLTAVNVTLTGGGAGRGRLRPGEPALEATFYETRRTDDLGRFRFVGVAPGAYRLTLSGQDVPGAQPAEVVVPPDRDVLDARVTTPGDRSVTVRLVDAGGAPLPGLSVQAYGNFGMVEGRGTFLSLATDPAGRVRFRGLPAGDTSFLCATMRDTPWVTTDAGPVIPDGQEVEVVIPRAAVIGGTVLDPAGDPLGMMSIDARDPATGDSVAVAQTDAKGAFRLKVPEGARVDVVLTGRHTVSRGDGILGSESTAWRGVAPGLKAPADGVVIRASDDPEPRDGALIVVVRYSSGAPAVGVQVSATADDGKGSRQTADADGVARLTGLPESRLGVTVWCGHMSDAVPVGDIPPSRVDATPDGRTVELSFERGVELHGRVVDAEGNAATRGFVELMTHDYRYVSARIGPDGRFVVGALADRAHKLTARAYGSRGELHGVVEGVTPGDGEVEIVVRPGDE